MRACRSVTETNTGISDVDRRISFLSLLLLLLGPPVSNIARARVLVSSRLVVSTPQLTMLTARMCAPRPLSRCSPSARSLFVHCHYLDLFLVVVLRRLFSVIVFRAEKTRANTRTKMNPNRMPTRISSPLVSSTRLSSSSRKFHTRRTAQVSLSIITVRAQLGNPSRHRTASSPPRPSDKSITSCRAIPHRNYA